MRNRVRRYDLDVVMGNGLVVYQSEFAASLAQMKARCEYFSQLPQVVEVVCYSELGRCLFRFDGRDHVASGACVM